MRALCAQLRSPVTPRSKTRVNTEIPVKPVELQPNSVLVVVRNSSAASALFGLPMAAPARQPSRSFVRTGSRDDAGWSRSPGAALPDGGLVSAPVHHRGLAVCRRLGPGGSVGVEGLGA